MNSNKCSLFILLCCQLVGDLEQIISIFSTNNMSIYRYKYMSKTFILARSNERLKVFYQNKKKWLHLIVLDWDKELNWKWFLSYEETKIKKIRIDEFYNFIKVTYFHINFRLHYFFFILVQMRTSFHASCKIFSKRQKKSFLLIWNKFTWYRFICSLIWYHLISQLFCNIFSS